MKKQTNKHEKSSETFTFNVMVLSQSYLILLFSVLLLPVCLCFSTFPPVSLISLFFLAHFPSHLPCISLVSYALFLVVSPANQSSPHSPQLSFSACISSCHQFTLYFSAFFISVIEEFFALLACAQLLFICRRVLLFILAVICNWIHLLHHLYVTYIQRMAWLVS